MDEANKILSDIKARNSSFAAKRTDGYLARRKELESKAREIFISKAGKPETTVPHYMVVEECEWLKSWYKNGGFVKIDIAEFNTDTLSFSYGDMFPTFSPFINDDKEYRRQIYTYN